MRRKGIPDETVGRLFVYLRALLCLAEKGVETVSSSRLAQACHLKASMIRKDFSYFGEFGTRGVGYNVGQLIAQIRRTLNLAKTVKAALVGTGNIGRALLSYPGFEKEGFRIAACFDSDRNKIGRKLNGIRVEDIARLERRIKAKGIRLGIVAVPVSEAPDVARRLAAAGVKAILSFAPCNLNMPRGVRVTCVDLATEMARLVYYL